jgi:hypothetical protein
MMNIQYLFFDDQSNSYLLKNAAAGKPFWNLLWFLMIEV